MLAQRSDDDRQHTEALLAALGIPQLRDELHELGLGLRQGRLEAGQDRLESGQDRLQSGQGRIEAGQDAMAQQLKSMTLEMRLAGAGRSVPYRHYNSAQVKAATNDCSDGNKLGSGGFGDVYRGEIDGVAVAIKVQAFGASPGPACSPAVSAYRAYFLATMRCRS